MNTRYYTRRRPVEAAQWNPAQPGDVIGLLANHNIHWNTYSGDRLVIDPKRDGIGVDPTDWVVVDDDGVAVFTDARFRDLFEAHPSRGGSITNMIHGHTGGSVIQAGDISGVNLRL